MKMKKVLAGIAVCAFAVFALAGCGGSSNTSSSSSSEAKVLKVGSSIDFAPFEFQDESQKEYQGFDMDLIRAIAKEMGYEVEIQNLGFDGLIPALQGKNIDVIISGMTINDERKQNVLFSDPYYQSGLTMVVRNDEKAITKFADLKGKKVAVQIGTTSEAEVKKIEGVEVKVLNTPADCFMELKAGGVDAVVNDRPVNDYFITKNGAQGVKALEERLTAEDYGIAIGKDNKELQEKINAALKKLKENGEYDKIFAKWFGEKK
ncbi:basic amino acid ABC transporter substrate-binding protein [Selenomonas sp. ND2010]|uniref:basic amino acid ABC transporter substrate-binding protein n=1 Tax=Selenomonas sp. ND2010 TaxID=1410618 RepID=UPI00051B7BBA|nr:basic amino acid ABC transporter substrate-binding protein [Selenomonas sp. ND2010]